MRLFFAIDIPADIKYEIAKLTERYKRLRVRWIVPKNLHITLLFLGERAADDVEGIISAASAAAAESKRFTLDFTRILPVPPGRAARMLWLSGSAPEPFGALVGTLSRHVGVPAKGYPSHRAPRLHVTLARAEGFDGTLTGKEFEALSLPLVHVEEFSLMESRLRPEGPEYRIIETFALH